MPQNIPMKGESGENEGLCDFLPNAISRTVRGSRQSVGCLKRSRESRSTENNTLRVFCLVLFQ